MIRDAGSGSGGNPAILSFGRVENVRDHLWRGERELRLIWPWRDRNRGFSWLEAVTLAFMLGPALWRLYSTAAGELGIRPLGELLFLSGIWSMAILLLTLAITPGATMFRWSRLIIVRRMIGVTALVNTLAHMVIYFALRFWDFTVIGNEIATSADTAESLPLTLIKHPRASSQEPLIVSSSGLRVGRISISALAR
jgi:hypothetical protein